LGEFSDIDFVIVGRGPEEEALRGLAATLEIAERVHFVGWRSDVSAILKSSTLCVIPSRWEGMPNVALEAMTAELPLVATQAEGVSELLGPLAEQQSVAFGDAESFVQRVASILRDPQLAQHLGRLNRLRVENEFSLQKMVGRYERLYAELLEPLAAGENLENPSE
jgi:glycosyltransferase involved in cell wall biosynthesis